MGETLSLGAGFKSVTHATTGGPAATQGSCGGVGPEYVVEVVPQVTGRLGVTISSGTGQFAYVREGGCEGEELGCVSAVGQQSQIHVEKGSSYYVFLDSVAGGGTVNVTLTLSTCGDGVINGGEQCDDGNQVMGDGCANDCSVECAGPGESLMVSTNTCYRYVSSKKTIGDAANECTAWHGKLTSIHSAAEQAFVHGLISDDSWIGLRDDGGFKWVDATPLNYTNWANNEPIGINEKCVEMYENSASFPAHDAGTWNNTRCTDLVGSDPARAFVCKRPPAGAVITPTP